MKTMVKIIPGFPARYASIARILSEDALRHPIRPEHKGQLAISNSRQQTPSRKRKAREDDTTSNEAPAEARPRHERKVTGDAQWPTCPWSFKTDQSLKQVCSSNKPQRV